MSPPLSRCKGKATELISLQELLPKAALHLVSSLADDDKEVLIFLVLFGRSALQSAEAPVSAIKSPWKPWKGSSSKAAQRQQVCSSCPFSDSLSAFIPLMDEGLSKKSLLLNAKSKAGVSCDCFSSYAIFWGRWSASTNRDIISEILDMVESTPESFEIIPQGGKGKKKKRVDRKRETSEKKVEKDDSSHSVRANATRDPAVSDENPDAVRSMGKDGISYIPVGSHTSISVEDGLMAIEGRSSITADKCTPGRKKSLFRGIKQKEKSSVSSSNLAPASAGDVQNAVSVVASVLSESEKSSGAVAIEIPENLTLDLSASVGLGLSVAVSQAKSSPKLQQHSRLGKRRSNQVLPLDCEDEDVSAMEREQEAVIVVDNSRPPMSPRVADAGLGGRGFLARVFPDALGRVASRLWDLISFRPRSHAVEYH